MQNSHFNHIKNIFSSQSFSIIKRNKKKGVCEMKRKKIMMGMLSIMVAGALLFSGCAGMTAANKNGNTSMPANYKNEKGSEGMGRGMGYGRGHGMEHSRYGKGSGDMMNPAAGISPESNGVTLTKSEKEALVIAIEDEYKARDFYLDVMAKFGEVRPFVNIEKAEEAHIRALETLFKKYGVPIPKDESKAAAAKLMENVKTLEDACKIGVEAEIENKDMYERLFKMVKNEDVVTVFRRLQWASEEHHLPAFQRCTNGWSPEGAQKP